MGRFVEVTISGGVDRALADAVVRACPVDIFALDRSGALTSVPEREDECILCGRCVTIAPETVSVRRRYGSRHPVEAEASDA
jgi:NAD-dependent dihydropyrimidine dehydrogenase PreA subunit